MTTATSALQDRIAKAVEQVTCSRWEDTDDCGSCESSMVICRHSSYMYCDAHDTITRPGDRCPHAAEVAAAVLRLIEAEVRAAVEEYKDRQVQIHIDPVPPQMVPVPVRCPKCGYR